MSAGASLPVYPTWFLLGRLTRDDAKRLSRWIAPWVGHRVARSFSGRRGVLDPVEAIGGFEPVGGEEIGIPK